jgi:disulfide bond formation protein DsbB
LGKGARIIAFTPSRYDSAVTELSARSVRGRRAFAVIFVICAGLLAYALYLQHWQKLDPCPWCVVQRVGFVLIGLVALTAALHGAGPRGQAIYAYAGFAASIAGAAAAAYHVYLQADPVRATKCVGSPVERILDQLQIGSLLPGLLQYDGPCTLKPWSFLGLSIPEWSAVWFVILAVAFGAMLAKR